MNTPRPGTSPARAAAGFFLTRKTMITHICPMFMARPLDSRLRRRFQNPREILAPHVREGMTVLDFGCGPGFLTLEAARLVGETGRVIAVDLQRPMLELIRGKMQGSGLEPRITLHQCQTERIGLDNVAVDFAVAMYVVHEVPCPQRVIAQLADLVRPGGRMLVAEPKLFHVSRRAFAKTVATAEDVGFRLVGQPKIVLSWTALLERSCPD